ncbi:MAG: RNA-binding protein [Methylotenera sp.]|nr:MAG: RNA-binding protein [Methylotenera sp.]
MADLTLHVKREYFEQMRDGTKPEEFRLCTLYWKKRLEKYYDNVVICLGYPKKDDQSKRLVRKWRGSVIKTITHKHFGSNPVAVYAIDVRG